MATERMMRAYLRNVVGLGGGAAGAQKANAIMAEGLDDVSAFADMYDDDGDIIATLCSNVRKPAGQIPDPNWVAPALQPGQPAPPHPMIQRPGIAISAICEQRLALAAYSASIYTMMGRTVTTDMLDLVRLREMKKHKSAVENHNGPESLPEIGKSFTVMKFLDQLPTYLRDVNGVAGVALSYVIRDTVARPQQMPALLNDKPWSEDHTSVMDELVSYMAHDGPTYESDNAAVFRILSNALSGTSAMTSITRYQRTRNGRGAYLDLVTHNMGSAKWEKTVEQAEQLLSSRVWNGRNSRYPIRVHIAKHREAFNDLVRASTQITYVPPNETSRVRYLLNSIQTSDATILAVKTTIMADTVKKNDFEEAADFIMITAPDTKPHAQKVQRVSAAKTGKIKTGPKTGVEIRFYKRGEWMKLNQDERNEVMEIRKSQTGDKKRKRNDRSDDYASKIMALETQLNEQSKVIAALTSNDSQVELPPEPRHPLQPPPGFTQQKVSFKAKKGKND